MTSQQILDAIAGALMDNPSADISEYLNDGNCPSEFKTAATTGNETISSLLYFAGEVNYKHNGVAVFGTRPIRTKGH